VVTSIEEAKQFLRELNLTVPEDVVRRVAAVLQRRSVGSMYDLYRIGRRRDGSERTPICGKGTVDKISRLYKQGKLEPYLIYLDAEEVRVDGQTLAGPEAQIQDADYERDWSPEHQPEVKDGGSSDAAPLNRSNEQFQSQPSAPETNPIGIACISSSQHQEEMRELPREWLGCVDEMTLDSWLVIITDHFLSPSGLLIYAHDTVKALNGNEAIKQEPSTVQNAKESLLKDFEPRLDFPAPPALIQSRAFPSLCQHLEGDPIWVHGKSYSLALASFSAHVWPGAAQLVSYAVGFFIARAMAVDTQLPAMGEVKRLIDDSPYRDMMSQALQPVVYLLGGELVRRGIRESMIIPGGEAVTYPLGRLLVEMEDRLQRVQIPEHWSRPEVGDVREIADQLWDGSLGEEISLSLGKEYVDELLRSWRELDRASEILRSRLRTLVALQPFPGSCSECRKT